MSKKTKKSNHLQISLDILNQYTKNTETSFGWEFPIGLISDIEKALNEAYARGLKKGESKC